MKGTVKSYNLEKGYGFISPAGGGQDVFVHISQLRKSHLDGLRVGQSVSFDTEVDPQERGLQAINIELS